MITFESIEFKNFLSSGDTPTKVYLSDHKTTLVNNYSNNLKTGGKIIIPISGDVIS